MAVVELIWPVRFRLRALQPSLPGRDGAERSARVGAHDHRENALRVKWTIVAMHEIGELGFGG